MNSERKQELQHWKVHAKSGQTLNYLLMIPTNLMSSVSKLLSDPSEYIVMAVTKHGHQYNF